MRIQNKRIAYFSCNMLKFIKKFLQITFPIDSILFLPISFSLNVSQSTKRDVQYLLINRQPKKYEDDFEKTPKTSKYLPKVIGDETERGVNQNTLKVFMKREKMKVGCFTNLPHEKDHPEYTFDIKEPKKLNELKVTHIGQASLDDAFGAATRIKNMVSIFKRIGIKIDLISYGFYSNKFSIEHKEIDQLLHNTIVYMPNNLPRFLKAFAIFPVFVYAWKSCKKSDIIFADFNTIIASMPAIVLGKIFHKPTIVDCLDTKLIKIIPSNAYKYIAKNADVIFAVSHYLVRAARREYKSKNVVYVPNFFDIRHFKMDIAAREKIREDLGIKKDEAVIGYVGSFEYVEGVPFLLQAFKNLTKKYSNIKLFVMGKIFLPNPIEDNVAKLIEDMDLEDDVILMPSQPYEEVPKFLSACDITCCPKIDCEINRAANPVKVVEYIAMGLPTVCSAVGGIIDTIKDGVDGLLVKPGDVKDLEQKLEWVILNPERAKEIGENGRRTAIEKYSYEAFEDTVRQAISKIIDEGGGKMA